jgi:hypothetical protein
MTKHVAFALVLFSFLGCAGVPGIPGNVREHVSKVDNTKELSMEPAWLPESAIKLSLFKNTIMQPNEIVLTVVVTGARNFDKGENVRFNVDGKIYSFSSIDDMTDLRTSAGYYGRGIYLSPSNWSSKRYVITKDFLATILNAKDVWVRVDLVKTYAEGEFSYDGPTCARPAFREFYERMNAF